MVLVQKEIKRITIRPNGTEEQIRPAIKTIAYYKFENNLNDSSGNGYNMSWNTSSSYGTTGYGASYANFTGSTWTQYYNGIPFNPNSGTISFWLNYPSYSVGGVGCIIDFGNSDWSNIIMRVTNKDSAVTFMSTTISVSTGSWHYYTLVFNNSTAKIYLDGTDTGQTFNSNINTSGQTRLIFGNEGGSSYNTYHAGRGYLSEFKLMDGQLNSVAILSNYNSTKSLYGIS